MDSRPKTLLRHQDPARLASPRPRRRGAPLRPYLLRNVDPRHLHRFLTATPELLTTPRPALNKPCERHCDNRRSDPAGARRRPADPTAPGHPPHRRFLPHTLRCCSTTGKRPPSEAPPPSTGTIAEPVISPLLDYSVRGQGASARKCPSSSFHHLRPCPTGSRTERGRVSRYSGRYTESDNRCHIVEGGARDRTGDGLAETERRGWEADPNGPGTAGEPDGRRGMGPYCATASVEPARRRTWLTTAAGQHGQPGQIRGRKVGDEPWDRYAW